MNQEPGDLGQELVIKRLRRVGGQVVVWVANSDVSVHINAGMAS